MAVSQERSGCQPRATTVSQEPSGCQPDAKNKLHLPSTYVRTCTRVRAHACTYTYALASAREHVLVHDTYVRTYVRSSICPLKAPPETAQGPLKEPSELAQGSLSAPLEASSDPAQGSLKSPPPPRQPKPPPSATGEILQRPHKAPSKPAQGHQRNRSTLPKAFSEIALDPIRARSGPPESPRSAPANSSQGPRDVLSEPPSGLPESPFQRPPRRAL